MPVWNPAVEAVAEIGGSKVWRIVDTVAGRDGADIVKNIEAASLHDSGINIEPGPFNVPVGASRFRD